MNFTSATRFALFGGLAICLPFLAAQDRTLIPFGTKLDPYAQTLASRELGSR